MVWKKNTKYKSDRAKRLYASSAPELCPAPRVFPLVRFWECLSVDRGGGCDGPSHWSIMWQSVCFVFVEISLAFNRFHRLIYCLSTHISHKGQSKPGIINNFYFVCIVILLFNILIYILLFFWKVGLHSRMYLLTYHKVIWSMVYNLTTEEY